MAQTKPLVFNKLFSYTSEITHARQAGKPIVALESAVITHGLPQPHNLSLARNLETIIRSENAIPATIALLDGKIHVGLHDDELTRLAAEPARKVSRRDFGVTLARKENGGTTVAATLIAAHAAGIPVFATGGIGGVHRNAPTDISADLPELSRTPIIVVCAGAKSILDLPATLEYLETAGVPVIGYQTDTFPAFYAVSSGLPVNIRVDTPGEIAEIARHQWALGLHSAILVANPPPAETAMPYDEIETIIQQALVQAAKEKITGARVTPFLLSKVGQLTHGNSMQANLALLENNARLAAQIARSLVPEHYAGTA